MKPEEKAYVGYRLDRARETLAEAKALLDLGLLRGAVNRLYYACFYCVSGLLFTEGMSSAKHSGVQSLFHEHWVKSGRVPKEMGRFYRRIFDYRQKGDYSTLTSFESEDVKSWFEQATQFVAEISRLTAERLADEEKQGEEIGGRET